MSDLEQDYDDDDVNRDRRRRRRGAGRRRVDDDAAEPARRPSPCSTSSSPRWSTIPTPCDRPDRAARQVRLDVRVGPGDMGRVIGKRGRVANAIRTVVRAAAVARRRRGRHRVRRLSPRSSVVAPAPSSLPRGRADRRGRTASAARSCVLPHHRPHRAHSTPGLGAGTDRGPLTVVRRRAAPATAGSSQLRGRRPTARQAEALARRRPAGRAARRPTTTTSGCTS